MFSIGIKEVDRSDWRKFSTGQENVWQADSDEVRRMSRTDSCTMKGITWYEAARYCNWLSRQEGIPEDQWCFEPNAEGMYAEGMKAKENFLALEGYRLPTDAEWEFACRAGVKSIWLHGNVDRFVPSYSLLPQTDKPTVAWKLNINYHLSLSKPNNWGIAGMCTGISEMLYDEWFDVNADRDKLRNYDLLGQELWLDRPQTLPINDIEGRKTRDFYIENIAHTSIAGTGPGVFTYDSDLITGLRLARTVRELDAVSLTKQ